MNTVILDGVEYVLVPKEQLVAKQEVKKEPVDDILSKYGVESESIPESPSQQEEIKEAIPNQSVVVEEVVNDGTIRDARAVPSAHRQRYIDRELDPRDFAKGRGVPIDMIRNFKEDDRYIETAAYKGEKLFWGQGLELG